jgi:hypothetical protein
VPSVSCHEEIVRAYRYRLFGKSGVVTPRHNPQGRPDLPRNSGTARQRLVLHPPGVSALCPYLPTVDQIPKKLNGFVQICRIYTKDGKKIYNAFFDILYKMIKQ